MTDQRRASRLLRLLPAALACTVLCVACPVLAVSAIHPGGVVPSVALSAALGAVASVAFVLFGELLIPGSVRRWMAERRLTGASVELEDIALELEVRDPYTHGHSQRVARLACLIARRLGLPRAEATRIRTAAMLHDVGKVNTPLSILHKPGRLTEEEFDVIKRHSSDGAAMVSALGDPELTTIVRHHHERLDGSGYPDGLRGDAVPLGARIIAVADAFDAITSDRPYRAARPYRDATAILHREAGVQLDLDVVRAFDAVHCGRDRPRLQWLGLAGHRQRT